MGNHDRSNDVQNFGLTKMVPRLKVMKGIIQTLVVDCHLNNVIRSQI